MLVAGGDRLRVDGLAADLAAVGCACLPVSIHDVEDPDPGFELGFIDLRSWTAESVAWCMRGRRDGWLVDLPLVFVVELEQLRELSMREGLYEDFVEAPYSLAGLAARVQLIRRRQGRSDPGHLKVRELVVDPHGYRAVLRGVPLELTYMEFELLKFLMGHPEKVFTREALLTKVWGYEYFGGLRTVDVHIRRLRAKLGEEHARFIETVRGVGYRFSDREEEL